MNAVCTIVAQNYFGYAVTLMKSVLKVNPDAETYILIVDDIIKSFETQGFHIIQAKELGIDSLNCMRYKYDVTEYCTAVKPKFILYLFEKYHYDKVIYLDPDIFVYESLKTIWNELDNSLIVLTPHVIKANPKCNLMHVKQEESVLISGIYNLGFIGIKNSPESLLFLQWWHSRLETECYDDKNTGLFTDQKWVNMCTAFVDQVCVLRNPAYNVAWWNYHEKEILIIENKPYVKFLERKEPIVFFHFSGFSPKRLDKIGRHSIIISEEQEQIIKQIYLSYFTQVKINKYEQYLNIDYKYNYYENGIVITRLQRRMFRRLLEQGYKCNNPFRVSAGSYYDLLRKNGMLVKEKTDKFNKNNTRNEKNNRYEKILRFLLRFSKKILGIKKYSYLIRYLNNYATDEEQVFMLKKGIRKNKDFVRKL